MLRRTYPVALPLDSDASIERTSTILSHVKPPIDASRGLASCATLMVV